MLEYGLPVLYALFVWWFSTGVIIYLDGLPVRTFRWSMLGATATLGPVPLWACLDQHRQHGVGCLQGLHVRAACLGMAGDQLLHGLRHGPTHPVLPRRLLRLAPLRPCHPDQPLSRVGDHRRRAGDRGAHLGRPEPGRHLDLHGALVDASERQAQCLPGRAQPERGVPARAPGLPQELPDEEADEPAVPVLRHHLDRLHGGAGTARARPRDQRVQCRRPTPSSRRS